MICDGIGFLCNSLCIFTPYIIYHGKSWDILCDLGEYLMWIRLILISYKHLSFVAPVFGVLTAFPSKSVWGLYKGMSLSSVSLSISTELLKKNEYIREVYHVGTIYMYYSWFKNLKYYHFVELKTELIMFMQTIICV